MVKSLPLFCLLRRHRVDSEAPTSFYLAIFAAAAFLFFHASFIFRLSAFFCAAVIDLVFLLAAAGFAALALLAAQISRILCAWAFR